MGGGVFFEFMETMKFIPDHRTCLLQSKNSLLKGSTRTFLFPGVSTAVQELVMYGPQVTTLAQEMRCTLGGCGYPDSCHSSLCLL